MLCYFVRDGREGLMEKEREPNGGIIEATESGEQDCTRDPSH
jgi:hypothetical protein